jgi:predicted HTH transcriptional regulator
LRSGVSDYHRSYEDPNPIEISVYPDKLVVLSFPGPLPPVDKEALKRVVQVYLKTAL